MERDSIDFEAFCWPNDIKMLKRKYAVTKIVPWKTLKMRTAETGVSIRAGNRQNLPSLSSKLT